MHYGAGSRKLTKSLLGLSRSARFPRACNLRRKPQMEEAYETVEQAREAMRELSLTPTRLREMADSWEEAERAANEESDPDCVEVDKTGIAADPAMRR